MGCDIHCYVEVRKNDEWVFFKKIFDYRNYTLFGLLAGVRNKSVKPISYPRGFDNLNISIYVNFEYLNWRFDAHSESYLMAYELTKEKLIENDLYRINEIKTDYEYLQKLIEQNGKDNVRMIFWFDN